MSRHNNRKLTHLQQIIMDYMTVPGYTQDYIMVPGYTQRWTVNHLSTMISFTDKRGIREALIRLETKGLLVSREIECPGCFLKVLIWEKA